MRRDLAELFASLISRPGIEIKHPRLVRGVKLYPVKPEVAKTFESDSKLFYELMK